MIESIKKQLLEDAEPEFKDFTSRLMPGVENVLGVRLPKLRKIAKGIVKMDFRAYLQGARDDSYEEIMLQGMVIGYAKMEWEEFLFWVAWFVKKIDNWSVCDSFCSGLKMAKSYPEQMWDFLKTYLQSSQEFEIRFGVVMLLDYYVNERYVKEALEALDHIHHEGYYVKMAVAWAVSVYFAEMPEITMAYLKDNQLDHWTYNKALQKITESLRVDQATKQRIRGMKRCISVKKS